MTLGQIVFVVLSSMMCINLFIVIIAALNLYNEYKEERVRRTRSLIR